MAVSGAIGEPNGTIRGLRPVRSAKLHRVYEVVLSDGRILELVMPPPSMLRLLRSERQVINSEAVLVQWLSTLLSEQNPIDPGSTREEEGQASASDRSERATSRLGSTRSQQSLLRDGCVGDMSNLLGLLPELVTRSSSSAKLGLPYSIYQSRGGTSMASLPKPLTKLEGADLHFQLGQLTRQFAQITAPTGCFGHAIAVIASNRPMARATDGSIPRLPSSNRPVDEARTWSAAFHVMFEGLLRDSEDMAISLAYPIIRKHITRLSYVLDEVTVPSLFFVDGMEDTNVLIARSSEGKTNTREDQDGGSDSSESDVASSEEEEEEEEEEEHNPSNLNGAVGADSQTSATNETRVRIVGLRDWSNGIFGDPLMSTGFSNSPPSELLDGFNGSRAGNQSPTSHSKALDPSATTRLLLYQAYHATVSIVTEFYRPRSESTTRELAARRKLTQALMRLEEIGDDPRGSRHRRPSGDMSPAKKLKSGEKEMPSSGRHQMTIQEV